MENLRDKKLRNGALIAEDYQTGEILAYVGSAEDYGEPRRPSGSSRGSTSSRTAGASPGRRSSRSCTRRASTAKQITAGTMFMDVVTDFGDGYTPTDADNLERGPVRVRDALRFSLNIPAVKAVATIGNDPVQQQAEAMGIQFRGGELDAGLSFALGVEEVHPSDLVGPTARSPTAAASWSRRRSSTVTDATGETVIGVETRPKPEQVLDRRPPAIVTDILAGNTDPGRTRSGASSGSATGTGAGRRPLKTGTNNDARDLNAYGYIAAPSRRRSARRASTRSRSACGTATPTTRSSARPNGRCSRSRSRRSSGGASSRTRRRGWSINQFRVPDGLDTADVDPWTGLRSQRGEKSRRGALHRRHRAVRLRAPTTRAAARR